MGPHGSLGTAQRPSKGQPPCGHKHRATAGTTAARKITKGLPSCNSASDELRGSDTKRGCQSTYRETGRHTASAVSPARPAQPGCVHVGTDTRGELLAVTAGDEQTGRTGRPCSGPAETAGSAAPGGRCDRWTLPFCPLNPGGPWTPARPVIPGKPISPSVPLKPKDPF